MTSLRADPLCPISEHRLVVPLPAEPSHHPSAFETQTSSDWEPPAESEERINLGRPPTPGPVLGKAVVKGLRDSQRLQWEVTFELGPPGPEPGAHEADLWSETFHHLAARAIIRDFEQLAEREGEIEPGELRRPRAPDRLREPLLTAPPQAPSPPRPRPLLMAPRKASPRSWPTHR